MIEHTIYKEFIDKISELSDGIYPIITDLDNDLSYVPDKTADFFGFEAGEHKTGRYILGPHGKAYQRIYDGILFRYFYR